MSSRTNKMSNLEVENNCNKMSEKLKNTMTFHPPGRRTSLNSSISHNYNKNHKNKKKIKKSQKKTKKKTLKLENLTKKTKKYVIKPTKKFK